MSEVAKQLPVPGGGPIDGNAWPSQLTAHVVEPGPPARIHGYEVDRDLAHHYGYGDVMRLALSGELPGDEESRALDVALTLLAPIDLTFAPTHAALLARTCGARSSATLGIAALALAEQARHLVAEHAPLLAWLDAPVGPFPEAFVGRSAADADSLASVRAAMAGTRLDVPALEQGPTRVAALLAIVHAVGLVRAEQIEVVLVLAQLPCVMAEAFAGRAGGFQQYPMRQPAFRRHEGS